MSEARLGGSFDSLVFNSVTIHKWLIASSPTGAYLLHHDPATMSSNKLLHLDELSSNKTCTKTFESEEVLSHPYHAQFEKSVGISFGSATALSLALTNFVSRFSSTEELQWRANARRVSLACFINTCRSKIHPRQKTKKLRVVFIYMVVFKNIDIAKLLLRFSQYVTAFVKVQLLTLDPKTKLAQFTKKPVMNVWRLSPGIVKRFCAPDSPGRMEMRTRTFFTVPCFRIFFNNPTGDLDSSAINNSLKAWISGVTVYWERNRSASALTSTGQKGIEGEVLQLKNVTWENRKIMEELQNFDGSLWEKRGRV